jgi:hypothetical protein
MPLRHLPTQRDQNAAGGRSRRPGAGIPEVVSTLGVFIILRMLEPADLKALPDRNRDGTPEPPGARAIRAGTFVLGLASAASAIGSAGRNFTARFAEVARAAGAGGPIR